MWKYFSKTVLAQLRANKCPFSSWKEETIVKGRDPLQAEGSGVCFDANSCNLQPVLTLGRAWKSKDGPSTSPGTLHIPHCCGWFFPSVPPNALGRDRATALGTPVGKMVRESREWREKSAQPTGFKPKCRHPGRTSDTGPIQAQH